MNRLYLLLLLLLPATLPAASPGGGIYFQIGDFYSIKSRAAEAGKLLFVHFTASWCMPCQWMERNTFRDEQLGAFVNDHYLAVQVDIDARQGLRLKEEYQIVALPSMLIIDPRGVVIARYEESMDADRLLRLLRHHYYDREELAPPMARLNASPDGQSVPSLSRPALIPEASVAADAPMKQPERVRPSDYGALPAAATPSKARYGVQVGVFGTYQNAVKQLDLYQERFEQPVWIFPGTHEGRQIFRIVIGSFFDPAAAGKYADQLRRQQIQGIVKNLSDL